MTRIGFVSDLHIEYNRQVPNKFDETGDILIMAGDIASSCFLADHRTDKDAKVVSKALEKYITNALDSYDRVIWIPGNHEPYGDHIERSHETIEKWLSVRFNSNVMYCESTYKNGVIEVNDDLAILCGRLWTNYNNNSPTTKLIVSQMMNDYPMITMSMGGIVNLKPDYVYELHMETIQFLAYVMSMVSAENIVIATHHAPLLQCENPKYRGNETSYGYCSDLSNFILDRPRIKYWIHGHTHYNTDIEIGQCRVVSNQHGYNFERINKPKYKPRIIEISD